MYVTYIAKYIDYYGIWFFAIQLVVYSACGEDSSDESSEPEVCSESGLWTQMTISQIPEKAHQPFS